MGIRNFFKRDDDFSDIREEMIALRMQVDEMRKRPGAQHEIFAQNRLVHTAEMIEPLYVDGGYIEYHELIRQGRRISYFDERFYILTDEETATDEYMESSTTILSIVPNKIITSWRERVGPEEANRRLHEGGDRGSNIHNACYVLSRGGLVVYQPRRFTLWTDQQCKEFEKLYNGNVWYLREQQEQIMVSRFKLFLERVDPKIIAAEMAVWNLKEHYAGTLDVIYGIDRQVKIGDVNIAPGRYIADYKSGNESDKDIMQLASYYKALEERHGGKKLYDGALVIYLNAKTRSDIPGLKLVRFTPAQLEEAYEDFKHVHAVWKRQNASFIRPKAGEFDTLITMNIPTT